MPEGLNLLRRSDWSSRREFPAPRSLGVVCPAESPEVERSRTAREGARGQSFLGHAPLFSALAHWSMTSLISPPGAELATPSLRRHDGRSRV